MRRLTQQYCLFSHLLCLVRRPSRAITKLRVHPSTFSEHPIENGVQVSLASDTQMLLQYGNDLCANRQESLLWHPCRFQAILSIQEGVSVFRVVETNDFNQLPHITLAFRPGNDATVKAFLAGRLSEVQAVQTALERDLSRAQVSSTGHAWPHFAFAISSLRVLRNLHLQADSGKRRVQRMGEAAI